MHIKLDPEAQSLLCCPACKSALEQTADGLACTACPLAFPSAAVDTGAGREKVCDLRIRRPDYCLPAGLTDWRAAQDEYEEYHEKKLAADSLNGYEAEKDSVREIYTEEYRLAGRVLDVGGNQGRLRHFLDKSVSLYVSLDPYPQVFRSLESQPNLLKAFACLNKPCNFVAAQAEALPFRSGAFDVVHMRSVVDHFADPYLAFAEAWRCARPGGMLLVGLSIMDKKETARPAPLKARIKGKLEKDGPAGALSAAVRAAGRKLSGKSNETPHDDHMFRLTLDTLRDLFAKTGWTVEKEHWQKPPFAHCVYACGRKSKT